MEWSVGKKIGISFALALALMTIIGASSYLALNRMIDAVSWQLHTQKVLTDLEGVLSLIKDAEIGQRSFLITGEDRYLEPYKESIGKLDQDIKDLQQLTADNPAQQQRVIVLKAKVAERRGSFAKTIALRREKGLEAAAQHIRTGKGASIMDEIRQLCGEMDAEEDALMAQRSSQAAASTRNTKFAIVGETLLVAVLLTLAGLALSRNIAKPLIAMSAAASRIAAGDLTVEVPEDERKDEIGRLTQAFRGLAVNLRRSTAEISAAVNLLGSSASEILAGTTQVASGTAESAAAISETTTTVEEVRQAAQLSSQKAKNVSDSAQRVAQIAQAGRKAVEDAGAGMRQIRDQMGSVSNTIVRLSEQSQSIGGIIATVTDLADQSNLLAVNAAIEAARAGEQGKGFAVVAQEIKSLAEQSKQATAQVRGILSDVQKATGAAVMATEQGSRAVEAGVKQAAQAGEAIEKLAESSGEAVSAAVQIVASSQQQQQGMEQIGKAMENINQAGAETAARMKQAETAAKNLHELGRTLKQLVEQYKV